MATPGEAGAAATGEVAARKQTVKSGKQRRTELQKKREFRRKKAEANKAAEQLRRRLKINAANEAAGIAVNRANLAPSNSYSIPDYVQRGYYIDLEFNCKDCGRPELWTATQQKWWYEVAKGPAFSLAVRCRACRRRERERVAKARSVHAEGLAKKRGPTATK